MSRDQLPSLYGNPGINEPDDLTAADLSTVLTDRQIGRIFREHGVKYGNRPWKHPEHGYEPGPMIAIDGAGDEVVVSGWTLQRVRDLLGY